MKFIIISTLISLFSYLNASIDIGKVELFKGNIKVKREDTIKKERVSLGFDIKSGDLLLSAKNSTVKVKLKDGSTLVIDERSSIHFNSITNIKQNSGKILYKIASRDSQHALKVTTPFAIIGIKGTTFIVNSRDNNAYISLKNGLISIKSIKEKFELYRQKVQQDFDNYISKEKSEFMKFKNSQNRYEVAEYTKEFNLKEGKHVSFNDNRVNESSMIEKDEDEFKHFEQLVKDIE